jgi:hypothetical protein
VGNHFTALVDHLPALFSIPPLNYKLSAYVPNELSPEYKEDGNSENLSMGRGR